MAKAKLPPRHEMFPEEIVALHDEGMPYPALYIGPLFLGGEEEAQYRLDKELEGIPEEPGDMPL